MKNVLLQQYLCLFALARIPIDELGCGNVGTLAQQLDDHVICAWNWHKLTVGDVKAARLLLDKLEIDWRLKGVPR